MLNNIAVIRPPGDGWPEMVYNGHLLDCRLIDDVVEILEPGNEYSTQILCFHNRGDYLQQPFSSLYDGTVLDLIPQSWHRHINEKRVHIVINTSEESWGPLYQDKINHIESADIHLNLAAAAHRLGIDPTQITWLAGDLNAQAHCADSEINVKSICWFKHSFVRVLSNGAPGYKDKFVNHNNNPEHFMIFLNRWPKAHRSYIAARLWEFRNDPENMQLHDMIWSFPKDLHGQNVCSSYCDIKYKKDMYGDQFDKNDLIDWSALRDNTLDLYYNLPFVADCIDKDTNDCAGIDAVDSVQQLYQESAFSLITETWAEGGKSFISEAIFMAICYGVPFMVVGTSGVLRHLQEFGFKTYGDIFDESYDQIEDDVQRWEAVLAEVVKLSKLPRKEYMQLRRSVQHITEYNYNKMYEIADQAESDLRDWIVSL